MERVAELVVILSITAAIAISGCIQNAGQDGQQQPGTSGDHAASSPATDASRGADYANTDCGSIRNATEREACIESQSKPDDLPYLQEANRTFNYSLCGYVQNNASKNNCILKIAEETLNISLCDIVTDTQSCYGSITQKTGAYSCDILSGHSKDWCYQVAAEKKMNETICNFISDPSKKEQCVSSVRRT